MDQTDLRSRSNRQSLGPVDRFHQDETVGKSDNSVVVLRGLFTSHRDALEMFQLSDRLLNPGSGPVKQARKEFWPIVDVRTIRE